MTPEEQQALFEQQQMAGSVGQQAQASASAQYYVQEQEKNLAEAQLDVEKTLTRIYHLLKQDILKPSKDGRIEWQPIKDEKQRALTNQGVERLMQVMESYVNKETLLSNFDEKMINTRMLEFALSLNANIFMKYEVYFREPTITECKEILDERLEVQKEIKMYAREVVGAEVDEEAIKKEVLQGIEKRIEYELEKIKVERRRRNLREYELLFVQLKAIVEATHNRAWKGEERGSLRRHTNISEIIGGSHQAPKTNEGGMFKWMRN